MLHPIELKLSGDLQDQLDPGEDEDASYSVGYDAFIRDIRSNENYHLVKDKQGRFFFVNPLEEMATLEKEKDNFKFFYTIPISEYDKYVNQGQVRPIIEFTDKENDIMIQADAMWQASCGMMLLGPDELQVNSMTGLDDILKNPSNPLNIASELGFPITFGLVAGILHHQYALKEFKEQYGRDPIGKELSALRKDSAAFAAKVCIGMGAWEAGQFVGQAIITLTSFSPAGAWVPLVISVCAGLFQAIAMVATQIADEKRKYGELRSSSADLIRLFFKTFITGTVWSMCSMIPIIPWLSNVMLKPLAKIVGSIVMGLATWASLKLVNRLVDRKVEQSTSPQQRFSLFNHPDALPVPLPPPSPRRRSS